jgi:hypothetical protein
LRHNHIEKIFFTSIFVEKKFIKEFKDIIESYPVKCISLPSPSPLFARMSLESKVQYYRDLLPRLKSKQKIASGKGMKTKVVAKVGKDIAASHKYLIALSDAQVYLFTPVTIHDASINSWSSPVLLGSTFKFMYWVMVAEFPDVIKVPEEVIEQLEEYTRKWKERLMKKRR